MANLNSLVMRIGADTSGLAAGIKLTRAEIGRLNRIQQMAKSDTDRLRESTHTVVKAYQLGAVSAKQMATQIGFLRDKYGATAAATAQQASAVKQAAAIDKAAASDRAASIERTRSAGLKLQAQINAEKQAVEESRKALLNRLSVYKRDKEAKEASESASRKLAVAEARNAIAQTKKSMEATSGQASMLVSGLKSAAAAYLGFQAIKSVGTVAMEMEQAAIAFEVFTGSAQEGNQILGDIKQLAASTPLEFTGVSGAARTMLSFGLSTKQVIPSLRQLGDISGGNQERFKNLALVFSQVAANGKLMGQDLLQFVNAGFNPLQQMSETTGESMEQLRKRMSDGGISFKEVAEAMNSATSEGGRFFGMMDKFGGTASGSIAQLKSQFVELSNDIGTLVLPAVASIATAIKETIEWVRGYAGSFSELNAKIVAGNAGFIVAVGILPKLISIISSIITVTRTWITSQLTLLSLQGPKGWAQIAAGLAIAAASIYAVDAAFGAMDARAQAAKESVASVAVAARVAGATMEEAVQWETEKTKNAQDYIDRLKEQNIELAMGAEWAAEFNAIKDGIAEAQKAELALAKERNAQLTAAKKLEEDRLAAINAAREARQKQVDEVRQAGEKFAESMRSPFDQLADKLTEIETMRRTGELNSDQAANSQAEAMAGYKGQQKPIRVELPPNVKAGSREEYKAIADIFSGNRAREENRFKESREIAMAQRVAAERAANALEGMTGTGAV